MPRGVELARGGRVSQELAVDPDEHKQSKPATAGVALSARQRCQTRGAVSQPAEPRQRNNGAHGGRDERDKKAKGAQDGCKPRHETGAVRVPGRPRRRRLCQPLVCDAAASQP